MQNEKALKIGFIGLGIMGKAMAVNLLEDGFQLCIYNRDFNKTTALMKELEELGKEKAAIAAKSIAETVKSCDVALTMVSTPAAVEAIAFGPDGVLENLPDGKLWMDCTTVNPSFSEKMATEAKKHNIRFLDSPVAGSKPHAEGRQLVFLVGGEDSDYQEALPLMQTMGKKAVHVGEHGKGSAMKMVVNHMLALSMLSFSEALVFGEGQGISQEMLFKVLLGGPVTAPFVGLKEEKIKNLEFSPEFPMEWMQKDLHLAAMTAWENDVSLPLSNTAKEVYQLAKRQGMSRKDFSAIYQFLKQENTSKN